MGNPNETPWVYNLRSGPLYDPDSSDDDNDSNKLQGISEDSRLLQELDISSRKETAQYKPNPFSIAKINAVIRSNIIHPTEKTIQRPSNASGSAFVRPASDANALINKKSVSLQKTSLLPQNTKKSNKDDARMMNTSSSTNSAVRSDLTALSGKATYNEKPYPQRSPRFAPRNAHTSTHTLTSSFTKNTHRFKTSPLAPMLNSPTYYNTATSSSQGMIKKPNCHTPRIKQESPSKPRQFSDLSFPPLSSNTHEALPLYEPKSEIDNLRICKDEESSTVKKTTHSSHLGYGSVKTETIVAQITPAKRPNCYDFGDDTDAVWTTLPSKKQKTKSSTGSSIKGIKTSGTFRLPLKLTSTAHKSGMSATSTARLITFLPPPLRQYPNGPDNAQNIAEDNLEHILSPQSSPLSLYPDFNGESSPHRFSSPLTSDPITAENDVEINWDTNKNNISCRYPHVYEHVQQHKQVKNRIWGLLGLPSCCYVSRDSVTGRYGITQWDGPNNYSAPQ